MISLCCLTAWRANLPATRPLSSACSFSSSFGDCAAVACSMFVACSLCLSLTRTLHRQAHRRLQCIRDFRLLFLMCTMYSPIDYFLLFLLLFGDCVVFASNRSVARSLSSSFACVPVSSSLCVVCTLTLSIPLALTLHPLAHRRLQCIHMQVELLLGFHVRCDDSEPDVQLFRVSIRTVADCVVEVLPLGS